MTKKKKTEEPKEEPIEEEPAEEEVAVYPGVLADLPSESVSEPEVKPIIEASKEDSGLVKVKVIVGTLEFEGGVFEKGDIFEVSRERAAQFESTSVIILE